jgi:hypothetical protein
MVDNFQTKLIINSRPIVLNEFAHGYITNIVICAVSMFKGGENVKELIYTIDGKKSNLIINGKHIILSPFPNGALSGTISGMVSALRGVNKLDTLKIEIRLV